MQRLANLVTHHPVVLVVGATALTVLAAVEIKGFDRTFIEYDFSKLRRADSRVSGSAYWGAKMDDLLGRYLTPIVMLTDDKDQAARLSAAMRRAVKSEPLNGIIDSVTDIERRGAARSTGQGQRHRTNRTRFHAPRACVPSR